MAKQLRVILTILIVHCSIIVNGQRTSFNTEPVVCYTSNTVERSKIEVEADLLKEIYASRTDGDNVFELTLIDVPGAAKITIEYATEIWSAIIRTNTPIKINVNWTSLSDGTLGSARPGSYETNFIGAPLRSIAYPIALAERLAQKELNEEDEFEIFISLNKEFTWSYGTDGSVQPDTHDLLSVVLHEIGHGLGLADTFSAGSDNGSYGTDGRANVYDYFVVNDDSLQLVDLGNFPNYSSDLYRQLTSNNLYTGSVLAAAENNGSIAKLYAPSEFNGGSSISHLDENAFPPGDPNSLMSPRIGREEVIHQVGPISQGMLAQMGYVYAFINHDTLQDQPDPTIDAILTGSVESDSFLLSDEGKLYYSFDAFETSNNVPIIFDENYNFTATIPAPMTKKRVSYYFEVADINNLVYRLPALSQIENFEFGYGIITSIDDEFSNENLNVSIYPNPSSGSFSIELAEGMVNAKIAILNLNGKILDSWDTTGYDKSYKRSLPAGLYIVQIESAEGSITEKVLVR